MKWDITDIQKWKWNDHPLAATIPEAGNAQYYRTGGWRTLRPRWLEDKCTHCLFCWVYCPDSSVVVKDAKFVDFDYDHCKGCGICAEECPQDAIEMVEEGEQDG